MQKLILIDDYCPAESTGRQNYSNAEIAEKMGISLRTTEIYVSKIYDKLGVSERRDLIK